MFDTLLESRHTALGLPRWGVVVAVGLHAAVVGAVLRPSQPPPEPRLWLDPHLPPFVEPGPPRVELPGPVVRGPVHIDLPSVPSPQPIPGVPGVDVAPLGRSAAPVESPSVSGLGAGADVLPASLVEEPPVLLTAPVPPYPALLREAGVAGLVMVQVVVDTTGRPEAGSLRVVQSSNTGFDGAALATIRGSLFRPGRVWGRAVRVLVQVPVAFRLHP
jgi:periplasmic protein TonB